MGNYRANTKLPDQMTAQEIYEEARDLRIRLTQIEGELSKGMAHAVADKRTETDRYVQWVAKARWLRSEIAGRYALVRPIEKDINRNRHTKNKR